MIQTMNPYASTRTAEIMSRYRPIAPKPDNQNPNPIPETESSTVPTGIRNSPYLRNVWANLQARPTRTRKRGRAASFAPPSVKRCRSCQISPPPPPCHMHGFVPITGCLDTAVATLAETVALPELPRRAVEKGKGIDLNAAAALEELDLLPRLEGPAKPRVISPRPVRPVGSSIFVEKFAGGDLGWPAVAAKGAEEVEEMAEAEDVPMIVSDSNNRVRMCNAAYKEMVGQPECGWLDCAAAGNRSVGAWRRIGGDVSLCFSGSRVQMGMHGFSCRVKIEWESNGIKKSVNAHCEGLKLGCQDKDYQFLWRFIAINQ